MTRTLLVMLCAGSAFGQAAFTEEALTRGIAYPTPSSYTTYGFGVAMADLDNDGDNDIITTGGVSNRVGIFENDGTGHFTDRTLSAGLPALIGQSGLSLADYDGDGDLDLYINRWFQPHKLYRNDGGFTFTDVTAAVGIVEAGASMMSCWADIDGDSWLDLYVTVRSETNGVPDQENCLFLNNGGVFSEVAVPRGVQATGTPTLVAMFFDKDLDGDQDLYVGTDKGSPTAFRNYMYENDGAGNFTDVTFQTGTEAYVHCMGIALGDFDGDVLKDIYVTHISPGNVLFLNNGDDTWANASAGSGTESFNVGWGCHFLDYDNDGENELYVNNMLGPNRLYKRDEGMFPCVDLGPTLGLDEAEDSFCSAIGDIDGDGDLDIVQQTFGERIQLFINHEGQNRNHVRFDVVGKDHNLFAIGANLRMTTAEGTQIRELHAGHGYKSQNEHTAHFGLGTLQAFGTLEVTWPDGEVRQIQNYPINQEWTIFPGERLGDASGDGEIDVYDLRAAIARIGQTFEPGDEIFDMDGDGDVDGDDLLLMGLGIGGPSGFNLKGSIRR